MDNIEKKNIHILYQYAEIVINYTDIVLISIPYCIIITSLLSNFENYHFYINKKFTLKKRIKLKNVKDLQVL